MVLVSQLNSDVLCLDVCAKRHFLSHWQCYCS